MRTYWFVDGPSASASVFEGGEEVELVIRVLSELTGDDPDEYTATRVNSVDDEESLIQQLVDTFPDIDDYCQGGVCGIERHREQE